MPAVITRTKPLDVMVSFDRFLLDRLGTTVEAGHVFLRAHLKQVQVFHSEKHQ